MLRAALAALLLASPAEADDRALLHTLAGQGCTIGLDADADTRALADKALANGTASQQGDWVVLSEEICQMRVPDLTTDITFDDPAVKMVTSPIDRPLDHPDDLPGCYVVISDIGMNLSILRGWLPQKGFDEGMRFVAAKIIAGEMVFYSPDPLATPMGFQSLVGDCANVPDIDAMRASNAAMVQHFGALIRAEAQHKICGEPLGLDFARMSQHMKQLTGGTADNYWFGLEMLIIAIGAGWMEGAGPKAKGLPRPPLCHYQ